MYLYVYICMCYARVLVCVCVCVYGCAMGAVDCPATLLSAGFTIYYHFSIFYSAFLAFVFVKFWHWMEWCCCACCLPRNQLFGLCCCLFLFFCFLSTRSKCSICMYVNVCVFALFDWIISHNLFLFVFSYCFIVFVHFYCLLIYEFGVYWMIKWCAWVY